MHDTEDVNYRVWNLLLRHLLYWTKVGVDDIENFTQYSENLFVSRFEVMSKRVLEDWKLLQPTNDMFDLGPPENCTKKWDANVLFKRGEYRQACPSSRTGLEDAEVLWSVLVLIWRSAFMRNKHGRGGMIECLWTIHRLQPAPNHLIGPWHWRHARGWCRCWLPDRDRNTQECGHPQFFQSRGIEIQRTLPFLSKLSKEESLKVKTSVLTEKRTDKLPPFLLLEWTFFRAEGTVESHKRHREARVRWDFAEAVVQVKLQFF